MIRTPDGYRYKDYGFHAATQEAYGTPAIIDSNKPLIVVSRDPDVEYYSPVKLISVAPKGHEAKRKLNPPGQRGIVVGLHKSGRMVVAFPQFGEQPDGYHEHCENTVVQVFGRNNLEAIMHGFISAESTSPSVRATRIATIYKIPQHDQATLTVANNIWPHERGRIEPERFILGPTSQRLLKALDADQLEIRYGKPSRTIMGIGR